MEQALNLETDLPDAGKRRELLLYYQPIIDLTTGAIVAVEALVRWQHPQLGLLLPHSFIPQAEQSGLILSLDYWVIGAASREWVSWRSFVRASELPAIHVNLSAKHLQQQDTVEQIGGILAETGVEPAKVVIEITESAMILDVASAARSLARLKTLGVRLAIDDFGAGYASLAYLRSFAVDILKIDQSLVSALAPSGSNWKIVDALIGLAHAMGMTTICEGIETAQQLEYVRETGCDLGQGYYFYHPMPADEIAALLRAGKRHD